MANFPTSVWAPASKTAGQVIQPSHVNDMQDEVIAVEGGLRNGTAPINSSNSTFTALSVTGNSTLASSITIGALSYVFPGSGASSGLALTIDSVSGSTLSLKWAQSGSGSTFAQTVYINDNANVNQTLGLTVNQGAADDEILTLKSSDIAHGVTDFAETDTYFCIKKEDGNAGGASLQAYAETGVTIGFRCEARVTDATGTRTTAARGPIQLTARLKSGTGVASVGADKNLLSVDDNGTARFFLDSDGDSHQDVGTAWTNFDSLDDALALNALAVYVSPESDPYKAQIREAFGSALESMVPRDLLERMKLVQFNDDGHHFVNMSKLTMLHTGAIRQLADRCARLLSRVEALTGEVATLRAQLPEGRG